MAIDLLPKRKHQYKACLHTHSTVSDGQLTPKEVKEEYQKLGYSIIAYSDHEGMIPHEDLNDENFLAMTACEVSFDRGKRTGNIEPKVDLHLNLIPKDPHDINPVFNMERIAWLQHELPLLPKEQFDHTDFELFYDNLQTVIDTATKSGCLVTLNHPAWSLLKTEDLAHLKNLWAIEWYNHGCFLEGYPDTITPYENILLNNTKIFPVATDDSHFASDIGGGWVNVQSDELNHKAIYEALKSGDFYSSTGPEIYSIEYEDNKVIIESSPIVYCDLNTHRRYARHLTKNQGAEEFTHTEVDIKHIDDCYDGEDKDLMFVRFTLCDKNGNKANTVPYFLKDFYKK